MHERHVYEKHSYEVRSRTDIITWAVRDLLKGTRLLTDCNILFMSKTTYNECHVSLIVCPHGEDGGYSDIVR